MYVDGTMENASLILNNFIIAPARKSKYYMDEEVDSAASVCLCEDCKARIGIIEIMKDDAPPPKKLRNETTTCCQACFGLSDRLQEIADQVEATYISSGFQTVSTFILCISVRSSALIVYQQAVWEHYQKEDGYQLMNSSPPNIASLKNFIKISIN